jgi:hypothetical protein
MASSSCRPRSGKQGNSSFHRHCERSEAIHPADRPKQALFRLDLVQNNLLLRKLPDGLLRFARNDDMNERKQARSA